jgi:SAM-dependent methyltransferase
MKNSHPARYNNALLPVFARMLNDSIWILDVMAGTGEKLKKLHDNYLPDSNILGIEIEPEWARVTPDYVLCADAFDYLAMTADGSWDAIVVSPVYGNRMSDHFVAKDASKRNTYTHRLGRQLSKNNSGKLQWGDEYRVFHFGLWKECVRVLKPNGKFILNIKDHIRKGERQFVTDWHIEILEGLGMEIVEHAKIEVPSLKNGQNSGLRIPYESVILFERRLGAQ